MRSFRASSCVADSEKANASSGTIEDLSRRFRRSASISPPRERNVDASLEVRPCSEATDIDSYIGYLERVNELAACSLKSLAQKHICHSKDYLIMAPTPEADCYS